MKKFDLIYEQYESFLREDQYKAYKATTFSDNVSLLVRTLQDNDYLSPEKNTKSFVSRVLNQPDKVKELVLDTQEGAIPPMKLLLKQPDPTSESFSVTVVDVNSPDKQKEFTFKNNMLETVFQDVVDYIKTASLERIKPEAAVDKLPVDDTAGAQPGAEQSALPGVEEPPIPSKQ